jgi:hypothetical protein
VSAAAHAWSPRTHAASGFLPHGAGRWRLDFYREARLDAGHFALDTAAEQIALLVRRFLS